MASVNTTTVSDTAPRFAGRTVFVTGGASPRGMSFATAKAFLA